MVGSISMACAVMPMPGVIRTGLNDAGGLAPRHCKWYAPTSPHTDFKRSFVRTTNQIQISNLVNIAVTQDSAHLEDEIAGMMPMRRRRCIWWPRMRRQSAWQMNRRTEHPRNMTGTKNQPGPNRMLLSTHSGSASIVEGHTWVRPHSLAPSNFLVQRGDH